MHKEIPIQNKLIFALLAINGLYSIQFSPIYNSLGYDNEVFQYIGMLLAKGGLPYIDVFDHKPPVIYLINAFFYELSGGDLWSMFISILVLNSICSILIFKDTYKFSENYLTSFFLSLLFISLMNNYTLMGGYNLTRQFCGFWVVFFFHVFLRNYKSQKLQLVLLSFISVLIFFTQENEILCLIPFLSYKTFEKKHLMFRNLAWFLIGFILSSIFFIGLFIYWGNFSEFLFQNFSFNLSSYMYSTPIHSRMFEMLLQIVHWSIAIWGIPIVLIYTSTYVINHFYKNKQWISIVVLLALALEYYASTLSGRAFGHYLLVFIPLLIYASIIHSNAYNFNKNIMKTFIFLIVIQFCIDTYKYQKEWVKYDCPQNLIYKDITSAIKKTKIKDYSTFYTFETPYLRVNYELNTLSPSKYVYSHFNDTLVNNVILNDLNHHNTKYVFCSDVKLNNNKNIERFINSNYMIIKSFKVQEPIPTTLRLYSHK